MFQDSSVSLSVTFMQILNQNNLWGYLGYFQLNYQHTFRHHCVQIVHDLFGLQRVRYLKVSKSREQFMVSSIFPKNEQNSLSRACYLLRIVSFIRFFWRIEKPIICFRDLLTFSHHASVVHETYDVDKNRNNFFIS